MPATSRPWSCTVSACGKSDLTAAYVCRAGDDHTRRRPGAFLHPSCGAEPVQTADGFTTVPVARAVVQVGLCPPRQGLPPFPFESLVAADGALHQGMVTQTCGVKRYPRTRMVCARRVSPTDSCRPSA